MVWDGTRWVRDTAAVRSPEPEPSPSPKRPLALGRALRLAIAAVLVGCIVGVAMPSLQGEAASPTIALDPSLALAGATVRLRGDNLPPDTRFHVTWDGADAGLPEIASNSRGALRVGFVVPTGTPGQHELAIAPVGGDPATLGARVMATAVIMIAAPGDPTPSLPDAGSDVLIGLERNPEATATASPTTAADPTGASAGRPYPTSPGSPGSPGGSGGGSGTKPTPAPPRATVPCGSSLQAKINAASSGATISLGSCTYHEAITISKPITIVGPIVVDGDNARGGISVRASNVTLDGLTVRRARTGEYVGAVNVQGASSFTLRHAKVRDSSTICVAIAGGSGHRILNSELSNCGKEGFFFNAVKSTLVQSNSIHGNNARGAYNPGWEAGGGKAIQSTGLTFRANRAYSNNGPGLWCDGACSNVVYDGNWLHHNSRAGILYEISSGATIKNNKVWENGWGFTTWGWGGGLVVSSSANVTVSGNTLAWNADGIVVLSQNRGSAAWNNVHGIAVRDNTIVMAPQGGDGSDKMALGWLQDWGGVLFSSGSANIGSGNDYWWSTTLPRCAYEWNGCYASLSAFNGTPGEQGGVAISAATRNARLSGSGIPTSPAKH
jgi:hypothetical protein